MTAEQWITGRNKSGLTQAAAARSLNVSQPYLSQLETGMRTASAKLVRKAARLYKVTPTASLPEAFALPPGRPEDLQKKLVGLGYPGFEHLRATQSSNPAEVILSAVLRRDLDTRLVEALPWVLKTYTDLKLEMAAGPGEIAERAKPVGLPCSSRTGDRAGIAAARFG
jgi:transcriptional regulator with XRE-family HTH domain